MAYSKHYFHNASGVGVLALLLSFLILVQPTAAKVNYVQSQDANGQTIYLEDNRQPALYTGDFGDCLGGSLLDLTRFDAAYYQDNMTVVFHMAGTTQLNNESLVRMYQDVVQARVYPLTICQCSLVSSPMARVDSISYSIRAMPILLGPNDVPFPTTCTIADTP